MARFDLKNHTLIGTGGRLAVPAANEITRRLSMLIEGECDGLGPIQAARKFGFSKQRYFQLRAAFLEFGAAALQNRKRRPKTHYRRTAEVVRQVIRHRFPRSGRLGRGDRPEAFSERMGGQHAERAAGD